MAVDTERQSPSPPTAAAEPRWTLRLLGAIELQAAGADAPARLPGRPSLALLARLALWPQQLHARETLVEALWPGVALDIGRNRLRQALSALRAVLEAQGGAPMLQADRLGLRLLPGALACDVQRYEQALRRGDAATAHALYLGELMPGFQDEWLVDERHRLAGLLDRHRPPPRPPLSAQGPRPGTAPAATAGLPSYLTPAFGTAEAVERLRRLLQRGARLLTLQGPGGSGKTRLAVELARRVAAPAGPDADEAAPRFDLVAFVPLVACTVAGQRVDAVLAALGAPGGAAATLAAPTALLDGRRVLLVLDNVEQFTDEASPLLADRLAALEA